MKITLIHRYFWPEKAPYAQMLLHIAKGLSEEGYKVDVLTSKPTHHTEDSIPAKSTEDYEGIRIKRLPLLPEPKRNLVLRALNSWLFGISVFLRLLFSSNDVVMVATTPPVIIAMFVRWASFIKKFQYIYHCQDLHPEAMSALGLNRNSIIYKIFNSVDKANITKASKVVVLSEDMKRTLSLRNITVENVCVLNNFIFEKNEVKKNNDRFLDSNCFNVLFAGNLGKFQGLEYLIEAAWETKENKNIRYNIVGDGVERNKLRSQAGDLIDDTVFFHGHVPVEKALMYMVQANMGLIMLNKRVVEYAFPSKTMMYLSVGLPILVATEADSDLARMITDNDFGIVSKPENTESLVKSIYIAYESKGDCHLKRNEIVKFAEERFGQETIINSWVDLYRGINV